MMQPRIQSKRKSSDGFVGLLTVLVVSVVALILATTSALLGINELLFSSYNSQSQHALHVADGCIDEAVFRLKRDPSYTGGTVANSVANCAVVVTGGGSTRTITATVVVGDFTRVVSADVTLATNVSGNASGIDVTQWGEQ